MAGNIGSTLACPTLGLTIPTDSDPLGHLDRALIPHVARVQRRGRLEQEDVDLLVGYRAMLDAPGDDEELALLQPDFSIQEVHAEPALHDEEQFVLPIVLMPDELATELDELDVLPVQLANDLRAPVVVEEGELFSDVHLVHDDPLDA